MNLLQSVIQHTRKILGVAGSGSQLVTSAARLSKKFVAPLSLVYPLVHLSSKDGKGLKSWSAEKALKIYRTAEERGDTKAWQTFFSEKVPIEEKDRVQNLLWLIGKMKKEGNTSASFFLTKCVYDSYDSEPAIYQKLYVYLNLRFKVNENNRALEEGECFLLYFRVCYRWLNGLNTTGAFLLELKELIFRFEIDKLENLLEGRYPNWKYFDEDKTKDQEFLFTLCAHLIWPDSDSPDMEDKEWMGKLNSDHFYLKAVICGIYDYEEELYTMLKPFFQEFPSEKMGYEEVQMLRWYALACFRNYEGKEEGKKWIDHYLSQTERLYGESNHLAASILRDYEKWLWFESSDRTSSIRLLKKATKMHEHTVGKNHVEYAYDLLALANAVADGLTEDMKKQRPTPKSSDDEINLLVFNSVMLYYETSRNIFQNVYGLNHFIVQEVWRQQAEKLKNLDVTKAAYCYDMYLALMKKEEYLNYGSRDVDTGCEIYDRAKQFEKSINLRRMLIDKWKDIHSNSNSQLAHQKWELANTYHRWATALQQVDQIKCRKMMQLAMDGYDEVESNPLGYRFKTENTYYLKRAFFYMEKNLPFVLKGPDAR